jgi:hypothetical protein
VVSGTQSDFRMIPERLETAMVTNQPDIVVWQIPIGPCAGGPMPNLRQYSCFHGQLVFSNTAITLRN